MALPTSRCTAITAAAVLVVAFLMAFADRSAAATTCNGDNKSLFDGYADFNAPAWYEGVSAYVVPRDGTACSESGGPGGDGDVAGWVMIAGRGSSTYAQVGFTKNVGYPMRWFAQFNNGGSQFTDRTMYNSTFVRHTFRVLWNSTTGVFDANIDSTHFSSSTFNPFVIGSPWGIGTWTPEYEDEGKDADSDVPGTSGARVQFTSVGVQRFSDNALISQPCGMNVTDDVPSRWHHAASSCTAFDLWG
jgi:hypothetical protein